MAATNLTEIDHLDRELTRSFQDQFLQLGSVNRQMVSFQANKTRPVYRWYKYKEAFSAALVEHLLSRYQITTGRLLDPFAGSGTALFAASKLGIAAEGIELLAIGQQIINVRQILSSQFLPADLKILKHWCKTKPWQNAVNRSPLPELRITQAAYPEATKELMEKFLATLQQENNSVSRVLFFALLCVLESVSYTRKDGQYLRWDYRAGRKSTTNNFDKGPIIDFDTAICHKIDQIVSDFATIDSQPEAINLYRGSCLEILPTIPTNSYDLIITSPPYCNRYDYTRTYALELALLGIDEQGLITLRQQMLSCTVENRAKDLARINSDWQPAIAATDQQQLLQTILRYLDDQNGTGRLNNRGIPRMVRGYFYELAAVIWECSRVLKPGAALLMVNDNVRYAGASISVDLILSDIARQLGFEIAGLLVLPNGKGNSSQQMGKHGRESLRKCVYYWKKQ